jgi:hypothetical protein
MQPSGETLDCTNLPPGSLLDVETSSRHYRIECLGGDAIRISGHPHYCPEPVKARLEGSVNREGVLDPGHIECGSRLVVVMEDRRPVTTSRVLSIRRAA